MAKSVGLDSETVMLVVSTAGFTSADIIVFVLCTPSAIEASITQPKTSRSWTCPSPSYQLFLLRLYSEMSLEAILQRDTPQMEDSVI